MKITQNSINGKTYTNMYFGLDEEIDLLEKQLLSKQYPNTTFFQSGTKPFKETLVKALESMAF
jgi:hypothetical protein